MAYHIQFYFALFLETTFFLIDQLLSEHEVEKLTHTQISSAGGFHQDNKVQPSSRKLKHKEK